MKNDTFKDLIALYARMDLAWDAVAEQYEFQCNGCKDNCCRSLFYHYTQVEKSFLRYGFDKLDSPKKKSILKLAQDWLEKTFEHPSDNQSRKIICPANKGERCLLYRYRPMICRLHGLPHELCRPGAPPVKGPGCQAGEFDNKKYIPFDRTPFYREMAQAELTFQTISGKRGKIKQTIAHMLLS